MLTVIYLSSYCLLSTLSVFLFRFPARFLFLFSQTRPDDSISNSIFVSVSSSVTVSISVSTSIFACFCLLSLSLVSVSVSVSFSDRECLDHFPSFISCHFVCGTLTLILCRCMFFIFSCIIFSFCLSVTEHCKHASSPFIHFYNQH